MPSPAPPWELIHLATGETAREPVEHVLALEAAERIADLQHELACRRSRGERSGARRPRAGRRPCDRARTSDGPCASTGASYIAFMNSSWPSSPNISATRLGTWRFADERLDLRDRGIAIGGRADLELDRREAPVEIRRQRRRRRAGADASRRASISTSHERGAVSKSLRPSTLSIELASRRGSAASACSGSAVHSTPRSLPCARTCSATKSPSNVSAHSTSAIARCWRDLSRLFDRHGRRADRHEQARDLAADQLVAFENDRVHAPATHRSTGRDECNHS